MTMFPCAQELKDKNINTIAICPELVASDMTTCAVYLAQSFGTSMHGLYILDIEQPTMCAAAAPEEMRR